MLETKLPDYPEVIRAVYSIPNGSGEGYCPMKSENLFSANMLPAPMRPLHVSSILFSSLHSYLSQFNLSQTFSPPSLRQKPTARHSSTRVNNAPANDNADWPLCCGQSVAPILLQVIASQISRATSRRHSQ